MLRFLLDGHINPAVVRGLEARRPSCGVVSLAVWTAGAYRTAADEAILSAAYDEGLTLVTYDQGTIPDLLTAWGVEGQPHAGVVFAAQKTIRAQDVGGLVRALVDLWDTRGHEDWTNAVDHLRRPR